MVRYVRIILCVIMLFAAVGCGSAYRIDAIRVEDYFTGHTILIPLSFANGLMNGEYATTINTNASLTDIAVNIRNLSSDLVSYNTAEYPNGLLIELYSPSGVNSVFFATDQAIDNPKFSYNHSYTFCNASKTVGDGSGEILCEIAWPYHLMENNSKYTDSITSSYNAVSFNTPYPTKYELADFLHFYELLSDVYPEYAPEGIIVKDNTIIIPDGFVHFYNEKEMSSGSFAIILEFTTQNENCITLKKYEGDIS